MAWSRVKNLLIVMLVAVNAFLIFVYGYTTWRENRYKEQLNQDLLAAAASLGITLEEEMTQPEVETLFPLQAYADEAADRTFAAGLLGPCEGARQENGAVVFETDRGALELQADGSFELSLLLSERVKTKHQAKAQVKKILQTMKQTGDAPVFEEAAPDQDFLVTVQLTASGMPVFNAVLTFEFYQDLVIVTGRRVLHRLQQVRSEEIQELPGVLLSLIGYWEERNQSDKTVTGIELGYLAKNMNSTRMTILPVWHVSEENGDWYVSALDGSIISPE